MSPAPRSCGLGWSPRAAVPVLQPAGSSFASRVPQDTEEPSRQGDLPPIRPELAKGHLRVRHPSGADRLLDAHLLAEEIRPGSEAERTGLRTVATAAIRSIDPGVDIGLACPACGDR